MSFSNIVIIVSLIIWLFPVFRQYKSNLFYYFFILALEDPIVYVTFIFTNIPVTVIHSIAGILLFYAVDKDWKNIFKNRIMNLILIGGFLVALFTLSNLMFLILTLHLLILSKFIKYIIIRLFNFSEINCFYFILIFYELTILINLIVLLSGTNVGYLLHYITAAFQMLVAIFFIIFKEDSQLLKISLKPAT